MLHLFSETKNFTLNEVNIQQGISLIYFWKDKNNRAVYTPALPADSCLLWTFCSCPLLNIWESLTDVHHFRELQHILLLSNSETLNLLWFFFSKHQWEMFLFYTAPLLTKLTSCEHTCLWKTFQRSLPICWQASTWRTFWSVQYLSEGKLLYTPSPANLNIWFSSAFIPCWEENKAARSRTMILRLECTPMLTE